MKKARIGDIVEIHTSAGFFYVQYSHDGGAFGELVRVLPGLHDARPVDVDKLVRSKELYFVFTSWPMRFVRAKQRSIANRPIPNEWTSAYPLMRHSAANDESGRTTQWRIVSASCKLELKDLQNTFVVAQLSPEQRKLSLFEVWPHSVLVTEVVRGWTPEHSEELRFRDLAKLECKPSEAKMRHFVYFLKRKDLMVAGEWLRDHGFSVENHGNVEGNKWLIVASKVVPDSFERMEEQSREMEELASRFGGEYDGWEAPLKARESVAKVGVIN